MSIAKIQELNFALAQKINGKALTDPQSPYAGKWVGFANGKVGCIANTKKEALAAIQKIEPDPARRRLIEASRAISGWDSIWWGITNEQEWQTSAESDTVLRFAKNSVTDRKLLLFGCACCRRVMHLMNCESSVNAVSTTELYVDGLISRSEWEAAHREAYAIVEVEGATFQSTEYLDPQYSASTAARFLTPDQFEIAAICSAQAAGVGESSIQCKMFRDISGNPFRPVTLDPRWLSSTVLDLARTIYGERAFERMPILADALMDAGCDSEEILNHCRSEGLHVRGCFVVDLLLGKE